jgi:malate synthase
MTERIQKHRLRVDPDLHAFIEHEALPGTGISSTDFWLGFDEIVNDLSPKNEALLNERARLQAEIDAWHRQHPGPITNMAAYQAFLKEIGYLREVSGNIRVTPENIDYELAVQGGPQLVAPLTNARYVLNAANARWLSLYDALYGTDAIPHDSGASVDREYNPMRGARVIAYGRGFLDKSLPLEAGSHAEVTSYRVNGCRLAATLEDGRTVGLKQPELLAGYNGDAAAPSSVLFRHNELHIEIQFDRKHPVGMQDSAGVRDIVLEAATTVIMDLEDAVAAVDASDKVIAYRNWLGLIKGDLTEEVPKGGKTIIRRVDPDRTYISTKGGTVTLPGRSLMFVRNVGLLMNNPAVLYGENKEIPEGILDAVVTTLIAMRDLKSGANSRAGSIYVVKPKLHGPDEAAFTDELFGRVEKMLGLPECTVKLGIMDEERRTSVNLKACVAAVARRLAFINTGFLDRTGDEMFTSMEAGPMIRKGDMRRSKWIAAYEVNNVQVGLQTGMRGRAQIGKGMWAMPDMMADMIVQKISHLQAGGNTAWVPSPTAAALHALHYHEVDVRKIQQSMEGHYVDVQADLLTIPVATTPTWTHEEIQQELDNNAQGILGYVVRWIDQGVGCSKVPDIHNVALMEDRATLRISSLHIANWMRHSIASKEQVMQTMKRMAAVVDKQNAGDPAYRNMAEDFEGSIAFKAACDLVFKGRFQPSGYTEPLLHAWRQEVKEHCFQDLTV